MCSLAPSIGLWWRWVAPLLQPSLCSDFHGPGGAANNWWSSSMRAYTCWPLCSLLYPWWQFLTSTTLPKYPTCTVCTAGWAWQHLFCTRYRWMNFLFMSLFLTKLSHVFTAQEQGRRIYFFSFYWADFSWSRTVLDAICTSIVESCIHASPHLHWPFHLHLCDSCGTHGYYWETDFCPVSMKTWCLWKGFFKQNLTTTDAFLRYWCTTFVCYIQEQPEVQGFSSRGHICQHYWNAPGSLWGVHPLHCHSKILETAYWADPAQLLHQRGRWPRRVATVWRNRVRNSQWHQKENFKLEDQADWIQSILVSWYDL